MFVGYRGYDKSGKAPQFAFGHGLWYTTFAFGKLAIAPVAGAASTYDVSFDITNTGTRAGAAVGQVYVGDTHAKVARPPKELKGFAKVTLAPGETKRATVRLDARAFTYFDVASHQWRADPGDFGVLVGGSSAQLDLKGTITIAQAIALSPAK